MIEESIAKGDLFFLHLQLNRPFQRGLRRRATFLEDGGYTGIFSAMLTGVPVGKVVNKIWSFNCSYMVHEIPEGLQHKNKYLLIT